jgi:hypothetical protein
VISSTIWRFFCIGMGDQTRDIKVLQLCDNGRDPPRLVARELKRQSCAGCHINFRAKEQYQFCGLDRHRSEILHDVISLLWI